jgi:hypothetical protein
MKPKVRLSVLFVLLLASIASYGYLSVESNRAQLLQHSTLVERAAESGSEERRSVVLPEAKITQRILDFALSVVVPR